MRMYFEVRGRLLPYQSEERALDDERLAQHFRRNEARQKMNSSK